MVTGLQNNVAPVYVLNIRHKIR